jgi:beta-galactosidase
MARIQYNKSSARWFLMAAAFFCLAALPARAAPAPDDGKTHQFLARDGKFSIDDQPFQIIAGEIHPSRIPWQFWETRIRQARAMGLNAVSLYIFWNQLEPTEGHFDFTGNNDVRRLVKLCQANGLWVILRPGPYVCAETEFGGYPAWLLKHHDLKVRSDDPQFMQYCRLYLQALHGQLGDLQVTHGGPILMAQVENELGRIDKYLSDLTQMFVDVGFDTQLFTCDHSGGVWKQIQGLPGILRGVNGLPNQMKFEQASAVAGGFPVFSPEVYTDWYSVWGGPIANRKPIPAQIKDTQWLLDRHLSFSFYMFAGGTNFGFSNGANGWRPVQTTYDYDAPVDELGRVTPKFAALRDLFSKTLKIDPPPPPPDPKVITIDRFALSPQCPLLAALGAPTISSTDVVTMEDLDQAYGFVLYRKTMDSGIKGQLDLGKALDYSLVMIDGQIVGRAFKGAGADSFTMKLVHPDRCTLDILVYNLGRNSVGIDQSTSRKGLNDDPTLDGQPITGWQIYSLPMDDPARMLRNVGISSGTSLPQFYAATFNLPETGETYLDMRQWSFGVAWVNGHNLGRFWDAGADRCLYLPSVWQNKGANHIEILELGKTPQDPSIQGVTTLVQEPAKPFTNSAGN